MNPNIRNVIGVFVGLSLGMFINGYLVSISGTVVPPPEGAILTTEEGLKEAMHLMQPKHFIMPFLAHAIGTFVGALLTALIADTRKMRLALSVGVVFLIGGIAMVYILPSPLWFTVLDLVGAYIPMAYLAAKLVEKRG